MPSNSRLQHMTRGAVSVSRDGVEFAISLGKALTMDETHQVGAGSLECAAFLFKAASQKKLPFAAQHMLRRVLPVESSLCAPVDVCRAGRLASLQSAAVTSRMLLLVSCGAGLTARTPGFQRFAPVLAAPRFFFPGQGFMRHT